MKKIPKEKRKVTELYFNEYDDTDEIFTYSTKLKKRLTAYAATYLDLCQLTEDDENGGLRFEIDKHRVSIRLTAPYSEERKAAASQQSKQWSTLRKVYSPPLKSEIRTPYAPIQRSTEK